MNYGTRIWVKFLNWFHCVNSLFPFPLLFQVYRMFSVWYGHYPYQVAEYDECPMSGSWDTPQPLSIMWRPWFSEDMDLFHFFQVDVLTHFVLIEIMVAGWGVMESPYLKKQRDSCGHWRDKVLEETPDMWGSLSWSLCLKKGPSWLHWKRATVRGCVQPLSDPKQTDFHGIGQVRKMRKGRPEVSYYYYKNHYMSRNWVLYE